MMSKADAPLGNNAVAQSYRAELARLVRGEGRHPEHAGQVVRITPASVAREAGRSRNPLYTTHKAILEEIEVASGGATPASDLAAKVLHLEADLARLRAEAEPGAVWLAWLRRLAPVFAAIPIDAGGEIGVLARAIARMAAVAGEKTQAARHSAELLATAVSSMSDGVLVLDPSGQVLLANPACKAMFGDRTDIGSPEWQKSFQRFHADGVTPFPATESPISRAMRGESFDNIELIVRRAGDGVRAEHHHHLPAAMGAGERRLHLLPDRSRRSLRPRRSSIPGS